MVLKVLQPEDHNLRAAVIVDVLAIQRPARRSRLLVQIQRKRPLRLPIVPVIRQAPFIPR